MIYNKQYTPDFGKITLFPTNIIPDNKMFLKCGTIHLKSHYSAKIYNKFPFNLDKLGLNTFPNMTSNTAPYPYSCDASSTYSHYSSSSGTAYYYAWRAFNDSNAAMGNGHAGSQWRPTTYPAWIQFNIPPDYFVEKYSILSVNATLAAHTCITTDIQNNTIEQSFPYSSTQTTMFNLKSYGTIPIKNIRWTFDSAVAIYRITLFTTTLQNYIDSTTYFEIPEYPEPPVYKAYVYIGNNNIIDNYKI